MVIELLAPDVDSLVANLMPWLAPRIPRARQLSRSGAVRRPRSPSLSPFWANDPVRYRFFQCHFPSFSLVIKERPHISLAESFRPCFREGCYLINCRGLKFWSDGAWVILREFDPLDLLVSFPLRESSLFFQVSPYAS